MKQENQLSIEDLLMIPPVSETKAKSEEKVLSPRELSEQGKKFTVEDEKRWTDTVWEVQQKERLRNNWVNWFEACDLYRKERDES